jgi:two-component system sensor histidine kinase PhoQ
LNMLGFRPLRKVATDVANIETGKAERLEGRYPSELEPLTRNVNRLMETEKRNQERIRNALDSLAHSLKTPLATIKAGVDLPSEEARKQVRDAADDMSYLIATRLQRAGASARRTLTEPIPVKPQVTRILESLNKIYSHKMIEASWNIESNLQFFGEKRDLLELMGNLLDNAFKYGSGHVAISAGAIGATHSRPGLWVRVEDDGPGIQSSQQKRLLQRGVRGDERVEGHGLGLAIVMELMTAYGGEMLIDKSKMNGAQITIKIPAS